MKSLDRRGFLQLSGASTFCLTLGSIAPVSNAQTPASFRSSARAPLKYVHATSVAGQYCTNCMVTQGEDGSEWRQCGTFPEKMTKGQTD